MQTRFICVRIGGMDTDLTAAGAARITWIRSRMPLLAEMRARFAEERPFEGLRIGMSLHVEPKTAVLLETLAAGGARSEEHTSELQSRQYLVCRLLLEKKT